MVSAWVPSEKELRALNEGKPLFLGISGKVHPVVFLFVEESSENADKE
jgi:hypothetical protein